MTCSNLSHASEKETGSGPDNETPDLKLVCVKKVSFFNSFNSYIEGISLQNNNW